ncbi:LuxR family transcriptional regulator [Nocardiopsis rhodophaea]|uniref:LuxR family transcriptional regulator n=1 Tax=Nocardiopsis rhodophaea TaxID=280238 RepID=A0ABP5E529_9ACTN
MLEMIGLAEDEEKVYLALLRSPAGDSGELAARLGMATPDAEDALARLADKGLLGRAPGGTSALRVAPPDAALSPLLVQRQAQLHQTQTEVARLIEDYRARAALHDPEEIVETVTGRDAVTESYRRIHQGAAKEVRVLVTGPPMVVSSADNDVARASMAAGVHYRVVYDRALLDGSDDPLLLAESCEPGEDVRVAGDIPMKLSIADDHAAFLPTVTSGLEEPSVIIVRPSGLLDALEWIFETIWETAVPFPAHDGEGSLTAMPEAEVEARRLISLMLSGCTDRAMANQLGVSVRTVQRRINRLSAQMGVRTRHQLIWQATRRGWL